MCVCVWTLVRNWSCLCTIEIRLHLFRPLWHQAKLSLTNRHSDRESVKKGRASGRVAEDQTLKPLMFAVTSYCVSYQESDRAQVHSTSAAQRRGRNLTVLRVKKRLCWLSRLCHVCLEQLTFNILLWPIWDNQNMISKWGLYCIYIALEGFKNTKYRRLRQCFLPLIGPKAWIWRMHRYIWIMEGSTSYSPNWLFSKPVLQTFDLSAWRNGVYAAIFDFWRVWVTSCCLSKT